eukprot:CAMPEP_0194503684 /NCGR_PEP_ID=MMETSP0253-20130528/28520_1 /TAXON_ID=2966 /ORGANISM="Noctiluca scintillans" /LENGTH=51 /DNA_ID=CAMNT_0039345989 /DNA_START=138 /DNA_END=290 /DNA_ORIENTATION=-
MDEHNEGDRGQRPHQFTVTLNRTDGMRLGIGVVANPTTKVLKISSLEDGEN